MRVTIPVTIDVTVEDWAAEYGQDLKLTGRKQIEDDFTEYIDELRVNLPETILTQHGSLKGNATITTGEPAWDAT